jgi:colicin import membrane protein
MKMAAKLRTFFPPVEPDNLWKSPVNLSIGLHILVTITTILVPMFVDRSPRLPEFYTVNLLNVTEVAEVAKPAEPAQIKPPAPPKVEKESAPVAVSEQKVSPAAVSEPIRAISIKPVKQKIRRAEIKEEQNFEKTRLALLQKIKESELAQKKSSEEAQKLAGNAVDQIRRSLQTEAMVTPSPVGKVEETPRTAPAAAGPVGAGIDTDEATRKYTAAVFARIQSHWYIPPLQNWDDSLEVILLIKVNRDGKITKTNFEKKSANLYFNQFVNKTVQKSEPLPPFPKEFEKKSEEFVLRFSPAGVY